MDQGVVYVCCFGYLAERNLSWVMPGEQLFRRFQDRINDLCASARPTIVAVRPLSFSLGTFRRGALPFSSL